MTWPTCKNWQAHAYAGLETLALFYLSGDILCSLNKTREDWKTVWKLWEDEGGIKVSFPQCQITQGSGWPCHLTVSVHRQIQLRKTRTQDHPDTWLKQQFVFHQSWHKVFEVKFHKSITHTVQFMCIILSGNVCSFVLFFLQVVWANRVKPVATGTVFSLAVKHDTKHFITALIQENKPFVHLDLCFLWDFVEIHGFLWDSRLWEWGQRKHGCNHSSFKEEFANNSLTLSHTLSARWYCITIIKSALYVGMSTTVPRKCLCQASCLS